jgi:hypothetical protein
MAEPHYKNKKIFYVILKTNEEYDLFAAICETLGVFWGSGDSFIKHKLNCNLMRYIKFIDGYGYWGTFYPSTPPPFNGCPDFDVNQFYKISLCFCKKIGIVNLLYRNIREMKIKPLSKLKNECQMIYGD